MTDFVAIMPEVAEALWGPPNAHTKGAKELRWGSHGGRSVDVGKGTYFDHETKTGGGVLDLLRREGHDPATWLRHHGFATGNGHDQAASKIVATYDYTDETGKLLFQVVRKEPKAFLQRRPDGKNGWIWNRTGVRDVPYHLPELLEAIALERPVFVVEGEKDVETLRKRGIDATCNAGGAGKWPKSFSEYFAGADVVIVPDNDDAGRDHADLVARSIKRSARRIRIMELPGLKPKEDVSDWFSAGGTIDDFNALVEQAPEWMESAGKRLILSSREFVSGYVAPDYLIDRIIQRRFLYSMTAPTGAGKTAIALLLAAHVGLAKPLGKHSVEGGRVLYLAGENPDDVRARWLAMANQLEFSMDGMPVHFVPGKFRIPDQEAQIADAAQTLGGFALIVVDTSATYFDGEDENSNVQLLEHARMQRRLTGLPGGPCVISCCHPVKNAANDNLIPRGGGSFLNEVDGNLVCIRNDITVDLNWQGKLRGPGFEPITFETVTVECPDVRDSTGRIIPTVVARQLSERERSDRASTSRGEQDALLIALMEHEGASNAALAEHLGWILATGEPHKSKVSRSIKQLRKDRLVVDKRGAAALTEAGQKEAKKAKSNHDLAGARYS